MRVLLAATLFFAVTFSSPFGAALAQEPDETVEYLLTQCARSADYCANEIYLQVSEYADDGLVCSVQFYAIANDQVSIVDNTFYASVERWLREHPEYASEYYGDAIEEALAALYNCRSE